MAAPKLTFYIDFEEDCEYVYKRLFVKHDSAGLENRLKKRNIDPLFIEKIKSSKSEEEAKAVFREFMLQYYREHIEKLRSVADQYKSIWQSKEAFFFEKVTGLMGNIPWKYSEYRFLVSAFFSRVTRGESNRLGIWYEWDPQEKSYLVGHELVLKHFYEVVDQLYPSARPVSDWHIWALVEIMGVFIVYGNETLKKELWPHAPGLEMLETWTYPQLNPLAHELLPIFKQEKDFSKYVSSSIALVSKYTEEKLKTH